MGLIDLEALGRSKAITGVTDKISEFRGLMQKRKSNEMLMESAAIDLRKKTEQETYDTTIRSWESAVGDLVPHATEETVADLYKKADAIGVLQMVRDKPYINNLGIERLATAVGKNNKFQADILTGQITGYRRQRKQIAETLADSERKLKPEEIEELKANSKAIEEMENHVVNLDEHMKRQAVEDTQAHELEKIEKTAAVKTPTSKSAQNYILPNDDVVLSYDGGRTYLSEGRTMKEMPPGAYKSPPGATVEGMRSLKARQQAVAELEDRPEGGLPFSPEEAARGGTGPYSMLQAGIDRFLGGLGVDVAFGAEGIFPDTQQNRQILRTIKQIGKAALINSPRFPIAEQKVIDKLFADPDVFFANPRTEAKKFQVLRNVMIETRDYNNRAIVNAVTTKEIEKLRQSNQEIDRFLSLIGTGEGQTEKNVTTITMPDGSTQTFDESGKRIQ